MLARTFWRLAGWGWLARDSTYPSKRHSLPARERIHRLQRHIDPSSRSINTQNEDTLALVRHFVASAALRIVPAGNRTTAADTWECWNGSLGLVTIF